MSFQQNLKNAVAGAAYGFRALFGSYSDATSPSTDRSSNFLVWLDTDTRQYLDRWTRHQVLRKVEWLFQNFGVIKEATRGIARLSVGRGICLQLNTDDEEWNEMAEMQFENWALSANRCDIAGRRNFYEIQKHAITQRIKSGEFFAAFVKNSRWGNELALQLFDPLEIDTPDNRTPQENIIDGVELDETHNPTYYYVRTLRNTFRRVPASEMIHWYYADATNQVRGVSDFAQAVAPLADAKELIKIVTKTAKQNSAIGLHIKQLVKKGGAGALDTIRTLNQRKNKMQGNPAGDPTTPPSTEPDPAYERLIGGGAIIYTDDQGDVKLLQPQSPSPLVEPFITNVLMRDGLASTGAPSELFWNCANLNSANQRYVLAKGESLFNALADDVETRICNPTAIRFLVHRMQTGKLRAPRMRIFDEETKTEKWIEDKNNHWMQSLTWQRPAKLTIDNGREAAAEINQLANGIETLSTLNDRRGRAWRPMVRQWFREFRFGYECAVREGVPWAVSYWRANMPGAVGGNPINEDEDEKQPKKPTEE